MGQRARRPIDSMGDRVGLREVAGVVAVVRNEGWTQSQDSGMRKDWRVAVAVIRCGGRGTRTFFGV